jgi:predicted phosphodiesterase
VVLVASDAHYWPDRITTAHRAFVRACSEMKPKAVIMNGDVLDGARISRHPPIGWESRPTLVDEIEACKQRLTEIISAAKNAKFIWTLGNHDARFETRLATVAPEYAKIHGVHLSDHFPEFEPAWACWINGEVVVKHRYKGGVHATHNNAVASGKSMVTGHLHSLKVTPYDDYNGTRWGVDTGTLAAKYGEQFVDYTEDGPRNWRSGFAVLTFRNGQLLWPEVVNVRDEEAGEVEFRGKVYVV